MLILRSKSSDFIWNALILFRIKMRYIATKRNTYPSKHAHAAYDIQNKNQTK